MILHQKFLLLFSQVDHNELSISNLTHVGRISTASFGAVFFGGDLIRLYGLAIYLLTIR